MMEAGALSRFLSLFSPCFEGGSVPVGFFAVDLPLPTAAQPSNAFCDNAEIEKRSRIANVIMGFKKDTPCGLKIN